MSARVTDLQYVAYAVPDLAAERQFYAETWGLTEVRDEAGMVYFAAASSAHPFVIRIRQSDEKMTDLIGYTAISRGDVDGIYAQAIAAGAKSIAAPGPAEGPFGGYAARFFDPEGRALEISCDTEQRLPRPLAVGESIPLGISHVVLHSPDLPALQKFYEDALGFKLSDQIAKFMVFLRCSPAHHRLAILPGKPALNHIAFDVSSVDEMMRGLGRLLKAGVTLSWGPGRHTAGNNTFTYYLTPNGTAVEYTSDLEDCDDATWVPKTYEMRPDITDQWGTGRIIPGNVPHVTMDADKGLWCVPA